MTDIYDEVGYIKEVLEKGLSYRWTRDLTLLAKYYHLEGMKKSKVKEILKNKCILYVKEFNPFVSYKKINSIVDNVWKNNIPLREIKEVKISKPILQWFLELEKEEISNEKLKELLNNYGKYKISLRKNIYTFNRVKFLFTLYVWGLIQSQYLDYAWSIDINRYAKRIKQDAFLSKSFKLTQESNLLYDLDMIRITNGGKNKSRKTILRYPQELEIFKKEYNDYIILSGEDLYNCGYWLEKQKYGTFICQHCGKEFAYYNNSVQEKNRKYCKGCSDIIRNKKFDGNLKIIICQDCGKQVEIDKNDVKACRCNDCQEKFRREYNRKWMQDHKEK